MAIDSKAEIKVSVRFAKIRAEQYLKASFDIHCHALSDISCSVAGTKVGHRTIFLYPAAVCSS
jgi:hypothetical protein